MSLFKLSASKRLTTSLLIVHILLSASPNFAQRPFGNFPKISFDELEKKKSTIDEDACAEVLFYSKKIEVLEKGNFLVTEFRKVKIFNKEKAEKDSLLLLNVYLLSDQTKGEQITSFKATVYHMDEGGNGVLQQHLDKTLKFKEKRGKNIEVYTLDFPHVRDGSVIEYQYTWNSPYDNNIRKEVFQEKIPIVYEEYLFEFPSYFGYNYNFRDGGRKPSLLLTDVKKYGYENFNFVQICYENIPPFRDEKFVKNIFNNVPSIHPKLNSVGLGGKLTKFATTWEDVKRDLDLLSKFGEEISKQRLVKDFVPNSFREIKDFDEKIVKVLNLVQTKTNWNKAYSMLCDKGVKSLISNGIGNSTDINFLLLMCLREMDIEAYPVIVATSNYGIINPEIPNLFCGNHVIVTYKSPDGSFHYLDASSKYSGVDVMPANVYNYYGVRVDKTTATPIELNSTIFSFNYLTIEAQLNKEGKVTGTLEEKDENTRAIESIHFFENNKKDLKKHYEAKFNLDVNQISSGIEADKSFVSKMSFTHQFENKNSDKIMINPFLFLFQHHHDFNQKEERVAEIEFYSPWVVKKKVILKIPEGYKVSDLPILKRMNTPDRSIVYLASYKFENNEIIAESHLEIRKEFFPATFYAVFQQFFDAVTTTEGQLIELVKI